MSEVDMVTKTSNNNNKNVYFGVLFPEETIRKIEKLKGYYSRNKYILRAVEKVMREEEEEGREKAESKGVLVQK